ncbi:MAG: transcriptional activator NhaR [Deltaproteobacteria bacterium]|nr:transcriptional activator NhaR [Deltaproteobacteria bacterium]
MEWLNYHHLHYFWLVAREGGLVPAAKVLRLSHPTLSAQIHALEDRLGQKLFTKVGRKLALTDTGRVAYRYAEEIFTLGQEMVQTVQGRSEGRPFRLVVGIVDVVPKLVVRRLLQPALALEQPVRLVCHEDSYDKLLAGLALHALDVVISDAPVPPGSQVRAFSHLLGETSVTLFGTRALVARYGREYPQSLDGVPILLPLDGSPLRRALDQWFAHQNVRPRVVAEFADSALMKVFGADGVGIFAAPSVMAREVQLQHGVRALGRITEVRERFYAITAERRIKSPAVVAISEAARNELFAKEGRVLREGRARAARSRS